MSRPDDGETLLSVFPDSARIVGADLTLGGVAAADLAEEFGTPLVVYCESTLRARARSLLARGGRWPRRLRDEGVRQRRGAAPPARGGHSAPTSRRRVSSSSPGPRASAATRSSCTATTRTRRSSARLPPRAQRSCSTRPTRPAWQLRRESERVLVRVTLGVDADTHEAIRTGHHGSKFGLPPAQARALIEDALARGLDVLGLHVHVGSQLADFDAQAETIVRLASFAASCRDELGWTAARRRSRRRIRNPAQPRRARSRRCGASRERRRDGATRVRRGRASRPRGLARAGTLARRVRPASRSTASVRSSDCRSARGSRSTAACPTTHGPSSTMRSTPPSPPTGPTRPPTSASASRACTASRGMSSSTTSSCPTPRRGDLVAVPATGAYTLAMASNYNGVTRPAAVLVARRRGTADSTTRDSRRPAAQRGLTTARELEEAAVLAPVFRDADGRAADPAAAPHRPRDPRRPARPARAAGRSRPTKGLPRDCAPRGGGGGRAAADRRSRCSRRSIHSRRWRQASVCYPFLGLVPGRRRVAAPARRGREAAHARRRGSRRRDRAAPAAVHVEPTSSSRSRSKGSSRGARALGHDAAPARRPRAAPAGAASGRI